MIAVLPPLGSDGIDPSANYACPSCHRAARLAVEATTLINLRPDGYVDTTDPIDVRDTPVLADGGAAICRDCGHLGTLWTFNLAGGWVDAWLATLAAADAASWVEVPL